MKNQTFSEERHAALWAEKSKQVGRWVFGTLVFGVLALLKVVGPYGEHAGAVQRLAGTLQSNTTHLATVTTEMTNNALVLAAVPSLLETINQAPWKAEMEQLKGRFRQLGQEYRSLADSDPKEVRDLVRPSVERAVAPEGGSSATEPAPDRRRSTVQALSGRELTDGASAGSLTRQVDASVLARTNLSRSAARAVDARAGAAGTFRLTPEVLTQMQTREQFRSTLRTNAIQVFRAEAKQAREAVAKSAEAAVVKPLETLVAKLPEGSAARNGVSATLDETRQIISAPPPETSEDEWWQTVEGKDSVSGALQGRLDQKQKQLQSLLSGQQRALETDQAALKKDAATLEADLARQRQELKQTEAEMQSLLPDWLRGLFGVPVLLQTYPLVLLALGGVVAGLALGTRNHFRRVRAAKGLDAKVLEDAAASTLWTLTLRGRWGQWATGAAYGGFYLMLAALQFGAGRALQSGLGYLDPRERLLPVGTVITVAWVGGILSVLVAGAMVFLLHREAETIRDGGDSGVLVPPTP